jgi:hypothetical protein
VVIHVLAHTQGLGVPAIATEGVDFSIPKGGIQHTSFGVPIENVFSTHFAQG